MSTYNNVLKTTKLEILNSSAGGKSYEAEIENNNLYIKYDGNVAIEIDPVNRTLTGQIINIKQQSSDPQQPVEGNAIIWLSDGKGIGSPGDLMIASTVNGETKYNRLFDYDNAYLWF